MTEKEKSVVDIKVLGSGCANCRKPEANIADALETLGIDAPIEKVTEYGEIASYGVMSTPALVLDDQVVLAGRVPSQAELANVLRGTAS